MKIVCVMIWALSGKATQTKSSSRITQMTRFYKPKL